MKLVRDMSAWPARRRAQILATALLVVTLVAPAQALASGTEGPGPTMPSWTGPVPMSGPPPAVWAEMDAIEATVEVPPGEHRALMVDLDNNTLVPQAWDDPVAAMTGAKKEAVDRVEPWLKRDLAIQLRRLGGDGNRFARLIRDCPEDLWVDEIAFSVAHTPPEVLRRAGQTNVFQQNAEQLYSQDAHIPYADLVERSGPDGDFTTVSYVNHSGERWEYPREVYYWYLAHARVFWEDPARVQGKGFWRKAFFDEVEYGNSSTLRSRLAGCDDVVEALQQAVIWNHMNMEFGYGTNPLQPVEIILDNYGSCGQFSIVMAAAFKVAMVPARVSIYPASDHQWNEVFYDGQWTHLDAAGDNAGSRSREREPEVIPKMGTGNLNHPNLYEGSGWKPYMAALDSFRSDDVVHNSIDIATHGPSFSFRRGNWTMHNRTQPCVYTNTSTVHITIVDSQGDPMEGSYVAVFRMGHDIYNPSQKDHPHFAYANYTNATGQVDFELGLQGYCSRCDEDHWYGVLVLSSQNTGTDDFFRLDVPQEDMEYFHTYTVHGDAPALSERATFPDVDLSPIDRTVNIDMEARGLQRHRHGEYGQYEMFGFGTTFDHTFPSDVDLLLMTEAHHATFASGGEPGVLFNRRDVCRLDQGIQLREEVDYFLVLSNEDSYRTTKVVDLRVNLTALSYPRLLVLEPTPGSDHRTDAPLAVNGTLWDWVDIVALEASLDGGGNWTDVLAGHDLANGTFDAVLDASDLPSGDRTLVIRATDSEGVWREGVVDVYLDAEDPVVDIASPLNGTILPAFENVTVNGTASDNRALASLRARVRGARWVAAIIGTGGGGFSLHLPPGDAVGLTALEVEATDGTGRRVVVALEVLFDAIDPVLSVTSPPPGAPQVVGAVEEVEVRGTVEDDHGLGRLEYSVDGGTWSRLPVVPELSGSFQLTIPANDWDDGEHRVQLVLTDAAGHTDDETVTFVMDTTPPEFVVDPLQDTYEDGDQVVLTGAVQDAHEVTDAWLVVDGGLPVPLPLGPTGSFVQALPSGSEAVGGHSVLLIATDPQGNEATLELAYEVVDVTLPEVSIASPLQGAVVTWGGVLRLSGAATDNVGLAGIWHSVNDGDQANATSSYDPILGTWSAEVDTGDHQLGPALVKVRVLDPSGNEAVASVVFNLADRRRPQVTIGAGPEAMPKVTKDRDLTITGTATDDVGVTGVEYRVDGTTWLPALHTLEGDSLTVTVPTDGIAPGTHVLDLRISDRAGNEAVASSPFKVRAPPEEGGIPTALAVGAVAAVILLVLLVLVLLRRRSAPGALIDEVPAPGTPDEEPPVEPGDETPTDEAPPQELDGEDVAEPRPQSAEDGAEPRSPEPGGTQEEAPEETPEPALGEGVEDGPQVDRP